MSERSERIIGDVCERSERIIGDVRERSERIIKHGAALSAAPSASEVAR